MTKSQPVSEGETDSLVETQPVNPRTDRARRRVDAEARLRGYGRASGTRVTLLRIPGIYALDREGGDPRERLRRGTPVLAPEMQLRRWLRE